MTQETKTPRQFNMFTGELDDNRTNRQRKLDRERQQPQQTEMFSQSELAQFGVRKTAWPLSPSTKLGLFREDPRTEEEIEQDRQRAAEKRTHQMFEEPPEPDNQAQMTPDTETLALVVYEAPCLALMVIETVNRAVIPFAAARRDDPHIRRQIVPSHEAA